jgi:diguanylate cyclase (GGDEF)-like protein
LRKGSLALLLVFGATGLGNVFAQTAPRSDAGAPRIATTVAQVRALTSAQIASGVPVELRGVATYYEPGEGQVFVQDGTGAIFVQAPASPPAVTPGDEVLIRGITVPSFSVNVKATSIERLGQGRLPEPMAVTWSGMVARENDCLYVTITGTVRSATLQYVAPATDPSGSYLLMDVQTDGGRVRVHAEDPRNLDPIKLLDAQVKLTGVVGGIFDGKFQQIGSELWVSTTKHMEVLKPGGGNPAALPLTDIARILAHSYVKEESQRVHVRGSVTLYEPGLQVVVETPQRQAVLVNTFEQSPLRLGQVVDVVGFPESGQYSEVMGQGTLLPSSQVQPIEPVAVSWGAASQGVYPYELVSIQGTVAAEVHEAHEDTLVVQSGPHVFSAILTRPVWTTDSSALPRYAVGSRVRVTGVCFVHAGGPWNTPQWFDLELRTPEDVAVLANPSWWTAQHLVRVSLVLIGLVVVVLLWAVLLQRKVRQQTEQIRLTMESEAARERRIAQLETERGRVLEAINSMTSLDEVLRMILGLICNQMETQACWCELANGARVGDPAPDDGSALLVRRDIYSGAGERLGALVLAGADVYHSHAGDVLEMGASLAALAIDTRRLYETLVHRSQYDQLTNAANRFLLESRLEEALAQASRSKARFALVYIDLDQFKRVNDLYGHRVGDLYLQQVTQRLSERLRSMDTLARVGGDEFVALIPVVHSREEVEEIARRLMRAFDEPFEIEAHSVRGGASIGIAIYPEDGLTKDELQRVADSAMYAQKPGVAG